MGRLFFLSIVFGLAIKGNKSKINQMCSYCWPTQLCIASNLHPSEQALSELFNGDTSTAEGSRKITPCGRLKVMPTGPRDPFGNYEGEFLLSCDTLRGQFFFSCSHNSHSSKMDGDGQSDYNTQQSVANQIVIGNE